MMPLRQLSDMHRKSFLTFAAHLKRASSSSILFPTPLPVVSTQNKLQAAAALSDEPAAKLRGSRWFHMSHACPNNSTHTGALSSERDTPMAMVDRAVCSCNAPLFSICP